MGRGFILRAVNENQWIMVSAGHVRNPSSVNKFRCRIDPAVSSMNILIGDRGGLQRESYPDGIYMYVFFLFFFFRHFDAERFNVERASRDWRRAGPDRYIIDLTEDVEQRVVTYRAWNVIRSRVIHHTSFLPTVRFNFNMKRRKSTLKSDILREMEANIFRQNPSGSVLS